jgi:hypothetical protein
MRNHRLAAYDADKYEFEFKTPGYKEFAQPIC